jgi:hypothetical protein
MVLLLEYCLKALYGLCFFAVSDAVPLELSGAG